MLSVSNNYGLDGVDILGQNVDLKESSVIVFNNWIKFWAIIPCSIPLDKYMVDVSNRCCVAYFYILIVIIITDKYWSHHIICISAVEIWYFITELALARRKCYLLNYKTGSFEDSQTESCNHVVCVITQFPASSPTDWNRCTRNLC